MSNPHEDCGFEIDYLICRGTYSEHLDTMLTGLINDGSDDKGQMTEFAKTLYYMLVRAKRYLEERTDECEHVILKYGLECRLEEIKKDEQRLRDEYNEKRAQLEALQLSKSAKEPEEPAPTPQVSQNEEER